MKISVHMEGEAHAVAAVSFALRDAKDRTSQDLRALNITLASAQGKWRIYDIVDHSDPKRPLLYAPPSRKIFRIMRKVASENPHAKTWACQSAHKRESAIP